jgi:hypothetical protein
LSWFSSGNNFISKFIYPSESSSYVAQNTEENYITFSNNINYIESFNEIFEEYRKQNEADK